MLALSGGGMSAVLQEWVMQIGWKEQSILLSGFRGPDDRGDMASIKAVNRWLRRESQNNADPSKDYMRQDALPSKEALCEELEHCTAHYVHHFADSLRVMALHHPDIETANKAWEYHHFIAEELFHFVPEDNLTFERRHRDKVPHA
jgi:hypothetical protein